MQTDGSRTPKPLMRDSFFGFAAVMKISGYTQGELLDQPHAILRHPDMPKVIFKYLWDNIKEGKDVNAYVKNLCKDGGFYWVLAQVRVAKNPECYRADLGNSVCR